MFERFKRLFRTSLADGGQQAEPKQQPEPERLAAGDVRNPFPFEVIDCRPIALGAMSTTGDPRVAASFVNLRRSEARELAGKRPAEPVAVNCAISVPCVEPLADGPIFVAPAMEHKWDLYAHNGKVYARRSWTGHIVHVADVEWLASGRLSVRSLECEAGPVFHNPTFAIAQFHFLLSTYLEGRLRPYPIAPPHARDDSKAIALGGWTVYGRAAQFACVLESYRIDE
jgi:hypothetical protein